MKFCSECKRAHMDDVNICPVCDRKLKSIQDINEPVLLCVTGGVERSIVCGALTDAQIPYIETVYGKQGVSNDLVTGYDVKLSNIAITVPYSALPKAYDVLLSVGIENDDIKPIAQKAQADIEEYKSKLKETNKDKPMSNAKKTTVKVLSAIGFLVLVAAVVFGTDYVIELIKNLLGG